MIYVIRGAHRKLYVFFRVVSAFAVPLGSLIEKVNEKYAFFVETCYSADRADAGDPRSFH